MRCWGLAGVLLVLGVSCSSGGDSGGVQTTRAVSSTSTVLMVPSTTVPSTTTTAAPATTTSTSSTSTTQAVEMSVGATVAAAVCATPPVVYDDQGLVPSVEAWECQRAPDNVRVVVYSSRPTMQRAWDVVLDWYRSQGDARTIDQLPIVCGDRWAVSFDFEDSRVALVDALTAAGLQVFRC